MRPVALIALLAAVPMSAAQNDDSRFVQLPSFQAQGFNARTPEGAYDILLYVDGEAFLYVKDKNLKYLPLSGAPIRDAGTNYSQAIPQAVFGSFNVVKKAGGGNVELYEAPGPKNDYTAVIRVTDKKSGADFYHIHLDWTWNPSNPSQPPGAQPGRPGETRNNDPGDYRRGRDAAFQARGTVDETTVLFIRAEQVRAEDLGGRPIRGDQFSFSQPLPLERLRSIQVVEVQGRGEVELVEKPWEGNKFTAVVLITDRQRGSSPYSFRLVWSR